MPSAAAGRWLISLPDTATTNGDTSSSSSDARPADSPRLHLATVQVAHASSAANAGFSSHHAPAASPTARGESAR